MKIKVDSSTLAEQLIQCARVAKSTNQMPILGCVHVSTGQSVLLIRTTDLEITTARKAPASIELPGEFCVPARLMADLCRSFGKLEITITVDENNHVNIEHGESKYKLLGLPPSDFPPATEFVVGNKIDFESGGLQSILAATSYAAGDDQTRLNLTAIALSTSGKQHELVACATDGHRLALLNTGVKCSSAIEKPLLLPRKAAEEINKFFAADASLRLTIGGSFVHVGIFGDTVGCGSLTIRLIEDGYPDVAAVVPTKTETTALLKADDLVAALKRAALICSKTHAVRLDVLKSGVVVSAASDGDGEATEEIEAKCEGTAKIGFNAKYAIEAISHLELDDTVSVGLSGKESPIVIRAEGDQDRVAVIMPMKLDK